MRFSNVALASLGYHLPETVVSSLELEERLAPLYDRLGVSAGRLELMSGIRERRFCPPGTRPSQIAAAAAEAALASAPLERSRIGLLIHAAVCRDFMEPATASVVHARLGLASECSAFDLSNACLGFANALMVAGSMIERGELEAALIVSGEDGRPLVEQTLQALLQHGDRKALKRAYASLTIGSGGAAALLCRADLAPDAPRLLGGTARAATEHHELCSGDRADGSAGPLMETDSEALLQAGNALAARTFEDFQSEHGWDRETIQRVITHQVGTAHKRLLFETLELDPAKDFPTVERLGNIGSVSLPLTLARAAEAGFVRGGDNVCLQGIGSGLHCLMLAIRW